MEVEELLSGLPLDRMKASDAPIQKQLLRLLTTIGPDHECNVLHA